MCEKLQLSYVEYQASNYFTHWVPRPKHGMHSQRLELEWLSFLPHLPPYFLPSLLSFFLSIGIFLQENLLFSVCLSMGLPDRQSGWVCLQTPHTDYSTTYRESEEAVFPHLDSFRHVANGGVLCNGKGDLLNSVIPYLWYKWCFRGMTLCLRL